MGNKTCFECSLPPLLVLYLVQWDIIIDSGEDLSLFLNYIWQHEYFTQADDINRAHSISESWNMRYVSMLLLLKTDNKWQRCDDTPIRTFNICNDYNNQPMLIIQKCRKINNINKSIIIHSPIQSFAQLKYSTHTLSRIQLEGIHTVILVGGWRRHLHLTTHYIVSATPPSSHCQT